MNHEIDLWTRVVALAFYAFGAAYYCICVVSLLL